VLFNSIGFKNRYLMFCNINYIPITTNDEDIEYVCALPGAYFFHTSLEHESYKTEKPNFRMLVAQYVIKLTSYCREGVPKLPPSYVNERLFPEIKEKDVQCQLSNGMWLKINTSDVIPITSKKYLHAWLVLHGVEDSPKEIDRFCLLASELVSNATVWVIDASLESRFKDMVGNGKRFFYKYAQTPFEDKLPMRYYKNINAWLLYTPG